MKTSLNACCIVILIISSNLLYAFEVKVVDQAGNLLRGTVVSIESNTHMDERLLSYNLRLNLVIIWAYESLQKVLKIRIVTTY